MLRKLVNWILYALHLKERDNRPAIEVLADLIPLVYGAAIIVGVVKSFGPFDIPWYRHLFYKIKYFFRHWRMVLIGY